MEPLTSSIDTADPEFHANREHNRALVAELNERLAQVRQGGPAKSVERHHARVQGRSQA